MADAPLPINVAGLETARLAGVTTPGDGVAHGLMMFGLAVLSAIVVTFPANTGWTSISARGVLATRIPSGMAWSAFLSLFAGRAGGHG